MDGRNLDDGRSLQVAERLGEFGARLDTLERRVETELHALNDSVRRVADAQAEAIRRVEAAIQQSRQQPTQASPDMVLALQGMNRMADSFVKATENLQPPPAPSPLAEFAASASSGARRGGGSTLTWVGWVMAAATTAWMARGVVGALLGG